MTCLVCDIGGTNTRFGLVDGGTLIKDSTRSFANDSFDCFDAAFAAYLDEIGVAGVEACCIALAGIVTPDGAELTNRDWHIERVSVRQLTGAGTIGFLNDFEALGFALLALDRLDVMPLMERTSKPLKTATRMVLGAGTGFNAATCFATRFGQLPHVAAAECGHVTLPIEGEEELSLQRRLSIGRGRASIERALSGSGLREIHEWICERNGRQAGLSAEEIARRAVSADDADCVEAAAMFLRLLGRVAGDLALIYMPVGGIYLSGGVCRALAPIMRTTTTFREAFSAKGRMSSFMDDLGVSVLSDDCAALGGCAEWLRVSRAGRLPP